MENEKILKEVEEKSAHEIFQELEYILGNSLKGFSPE